MIMYLNLILSKSTFKISFLSQSENMIAPSYNHALSSASTPIFQVQVSASIRNSLNQCSTRFGSLPSFLHVSVGNVEHTTSTVTILKGSLGHIHTRWLIGCLVINSEPCCVVNIVLVYVNVTVVLQVLLYILVVRNMNFVPMLRNQIGIFGFFVWGEEI